MVEVDWSRNEVSRLGLISQQHCPHHTNNFCAGLANRCGLTAPVSSNHLPSGGERVGFLRPPWGAGRCALDAPRRENLAAR